MNNSYLMWIGNLAVIFLLKSHKRFSHLKIEVLLLLSYITNILMGIFVLFNFEHYTLNPENIIMPYSQSLFTSVMIFVLALMLFDFYKFNLLDNLIYSSMVIINYFLNLIAFPKLFLTWNINSTINGADFYRFNGSGYIAFAIELSLVICAYLFYKYSSNSGFISKKGKSQSAENNTEGSESKDSEESEKEIKDSTKVYSPIKGWVDMDNNSSGQSKTLKLEKNDWLILLGIIVCALPILKSLFF